MRPSSLAVIGLGAIGGSLAWQARLAGIPQGRGILAARGPTAFRPSRLPRLPIWPTPRPSSDGARARRAGRPPQATLDLIGSLAPSLEPEALLTDVCSVKAPVIARAVADGLGARFAGGHPLAGTHASGFGAASPHRLRGCAVYVCETGAPGGDRAARAVMHFWEDVLEASPILIDAVAHDRQLAWTSHLPQSVASALAKSLADRGLAGLSFGSGARDTTRLAASSPEMWLDILLYNREAMGEALAATEAQLAELRRLVAAGDVEGLREYLTTAQRFRESIDR